MMDRGVDCEVVMDSGTCSYSCEVEGPDSSENAATRHALDQGFLHSLSAFIAFLCTTVVFAPLIRNKRKPITL